MALMDGGGLAGLDRLAAGLRGPSSSGLAVAYPVSVKDIQGLGSPRATLGPANNPNNPEKGCFQLRFGTEPSIDATQLS